MFHRLILGSTLGAIGGMLVWTLRQSSATVPPGTPPTYAPLPRVALGPSTRLLVFGDSLAVGLGPPIRQRVLAAGGLGATRGKVGMSLVQGLEAVHDVIEQERPNVVFVVLGTNNTGSATVEHLRKSVTAIRAAVEQSGATLVWVGVPTLPAKFVGAEPVRALLQEVVGPAYVDSTTIEFERTPDGVHATHKGYEAWAKELLRRVTGAT